MVEKNFEKNSINMTGNEISKEYMNSKIKTSRNFDNPMVNIKLKLSIFWIVLMFFYIYNDIFTSLRQDVLEDLLIGKAVGMDVNQIFLLSAAILMSIPILMVFFSMVLPARVNRKTNIGVGIFHAVLLGTSMFVASETWAHYSLYMIYEALFIGLIIWYAWKWPTKENIQTSQ
jgi:hypothetical protein